MNGEKKSFPFEKTCMNEAQADYVINSVKEQYGNDPSWEIGQPRKEKLSNGEILVTIPMTKDYSKNNDRSPRM